MAIERSDEQRRWDEEEERHYWDSIEDDRIAEEERKAAEKKAAAIETMESWFHQNFEDPQIQMPRDSEDQVFLYPYGGPYEAGDILHDTFSHEFDATWIVEAAERITDVGTFEWAPTSDSEYYEHPDPEDETSDAVSPEVAQLRTEILGELAELKAIVAALPTAKFGHNGPPDEIGLPPYDDEAAQEIEAAIAETQTILSEPIPDSVELNRQSVRFDSAAKKVGGWIASKLNLAVDELIKSSIMAFSWAKAFGVMGGIALMLKELAHALLGG